MKNRLRVLRAERNWSQQQLAERLDVSRQSVNAIETGKYDPSLPLAFRIAELFGLAIEEGSRTAPIASSMIPSACWKSCVSTTTPDAAALSWTCSGRDAPMIAEA